MLFCTINDFLAYGNLSGYSVKGEKACPVCLDDTVDVWLPNSSKNVYMGHRRFLPANHVHRKRKKEFNGNTENTRANYPLTGKAVYSRVKDIKVQFGKFKKKAVRKKGAPKISWKKRSIFWDLPYWQHLDVRHCLDVMHVVKNVCDSLVGTLLNIPGKTKDGINARKDMQFLNIRSDLQPTQKERENGKTCTYLKPAMHTLSKAEKKSLLECLHGVKVPSGYSSNFKNLVSLEDLKLTGMKSHDCHVLMTQLLPVAIRGILPKCVRQTITKLCFFFNAICCKVNDPDTLDALQNEVVVTLCHLEMYFPPSFFDIMVHLTVHLIREIKMCGPVFLRYMYPFERYMGLLKAYVRNRYRPEGSIVRAYAAEEVIEFCTNYMDDVKAIGIPKSRYEGRLHGVGTIGAKLFEPDRTTMSLAHFHDEDGFILVDFSKAGYKDDPFILARQATQVFYVTDPADRSRHVVLPEMESGSDHDGIVLASIKKRGRGPNRIKEKFNEKDKTLELDKFFRPVVTRETTSFSTDFGILVRREIPIRFQLWKDVPDEYKQKIWEILKVSWKLPEKVEVKKYYYQKMAACHRKFRSELTKLFREGETPDFDRLQIEEKDWKEFVEYRMTAEFDAASQIGTENQTHNKYPHFLGSRGYNGEGFQNRLKDAMQAIADEKASSDPSSQGSTTTALTPDELVDLSVEHRHVTWKLARQKLSDETKERFYPETYIPVINRIVRI
ncbi:uncharacterized protein LOC144546092 [Carex rostrata]